MLLLSLRHLAAVLRVQPAGGAAPARLLLAPEPLHELAAPATLLQPRRNHGCAFLGDTLVLVGGRHAPSVELWDTATGEQRMVVANASGLNRNHFDLVAVDKLEGSGTELWVACGFIGHATNGETSAAAALVIDTDGWAVRPGPEMDVPRGACGALGLRLDGEQRPAHVCVFGGSVGSHDVGVFTNNVSCYDRSKQSWHRPLPDLPLPADHLNVIRVPAGVDCGKGALPSPERLLLLNFRRAPYGPGTPEVLALDLARGEGGALAPSGTWYLFTNDSASRPRDAGGLALSPNGRFLFNFGGVARSAGRVVQDSLAEVRALDSCSRRWLPDVSSMRTDRFAMVTCASPSGAAVTCGGTHYPRANFNLESCDVHGLRALEEAAAATAVRMGVA